MPTSRLPKSKEAGEREGAAVAVPLRVAVCGLLLALSITLSTPLEGPALVGVNVTAILHVALAFRDAGQLSPSEKGPVDKMFVILKETDELFVRVSNCGPLLAPTFVLANVTEVGDTMATGEIPVPPAADVEAGVLCEDDIP